MAGLLPRETRLLGARPFRAPHHTISVSGLVGGGSPPHPGEVTLAHRGVLFLDELPEFQRHVLESLRQPLEDGRVTITRIAGSGQFPARFQLVGAANPCRRGCPSLERCLCTPAERHRYLGRLSRPLLDRIDLHVELPVVLPSAVQTLGAAESSSDIRGRVVRARERQRERLAGARLRTNAELPARLLRRLCPLGPDARRLLDAAAERLGLSARGHDRIIRVARTIADLARRGRHHRRALRRGHPVPRPRPPVARLTAAACEPSSESGPRRPVATAQARRGNRRPVQVRSEHRSRCERRGNAPRQ